MAATRPPAHITYKMMKKAGIIALDLDGTLLNSRKELSRVNLQVLEKAAAKGFVIVPTTGRFYGGMPACIKAMPFVEYAITINGAQVQDLAEQKTVYQAELPCEQAVSIMEWLDKFPVIYDCYMDNDAFMTASQKEKIDETIEDEHYRSMFHRLRRPVPELKEYIKGRSGVQKIQFFTKDADLRLHLLEELPKVFKDIAVSSSSSQNVEINQIKATKGLALVALADYLGVDKAHTIAMGDGLNDISMLEMAGIGVAMANGCYEALEASDWVTSHCDGDGVAVAIEKYCFNE